MARDLSAWRGQQARLRLVDEAAVRWGHGQRDQVETFSLAPRQ